MNYPCCPPNPPVLCPPATGVRVVTQVFLASAPYMPSPGLVTAVVETIGGGGEGGAVSSGSVTFILFGGGGGSGGYSRKTLAASLVAGGVAVTVGGQGAATSFGALCVANGGLPGGSNNATTLFGGPGLPAPPGIGDIALPGNCGVAGSYQVYTTPFNTSVSGALGGTMWGGGNTNDVGYPGQAAGANGSANTGAGGQGAVSNQVSAPTDTILGGAGGSGLCIVTEYCWADVVPEDCGTTMSGARVAIPQGRNWQGWGYDND